MGDDVIPRAETVLLRLHERARNLSHPGGDSDKADIMTALALMLEMQRALLLGQSKILGAVNR
jgi:hypothetical protein